MDIVPILKGVATYFVPPGNAGFLFRSAPHETDRPAPYCYGVWLKHLSLLGQQGCIANAGHVAEFGPGSTLGTGLAALLSGAETYSGFDVLPFASFDVCDAQLDELAELFRKRAGRPTPGFPAFEHLLDENLFPAQFITSDVLDRASSPERIAAIHAAIDSLRKGEKSDLIHYRAPWASAAEPAPESIDLIFTQSVLQYIEDLDGFYSLCRRWLKRSGWMSHHIDLTSMQVTRLWNGHWAYPPRVWKLVRGKRPFFHTARTASEHLSALERSGFEIRNVVRGTKHGISRRDLATFRRHMSDQDLECTTLFVIAQKVACRS
ncbi:MAG: hypothetical protein ACOY0T_28095 [Myxococcota bacterium]